MYLVKPTRIVGEEGQVRAVECENLILGGEDSDGRRKPQSAAASRFILDADTVISALGEAPDLSFLSEKMGIETRSGLIAVDRFHRTTNEKVFAGGDVLRGPGKVIEAIRDGKRAAKSIMAYLSGALPPVEEEQAQEVVDPIAVLNRGFERKERVQPRTPAAATPPGSSDETAPAFTEEEAMREASRCLACGCAVGCGMCQNVCIYDAIDRRLDEFVVNDKCVGCGLCAEVCPNTCILMVDIEPATA